MPRLKPTPPASVLLVEDNPGDVELVRSAMRKWTREVTLQVARDGVEAMEAMEQTDAENASFDLILLDLNLPRRSGLETLRLIKSCDRYRATPVVVLTSSTAPNDVTAAYEAGANGYLAKSLNFTQSRERLAALERFWLHTACLPAPALASTRRLAPRSESLDTTLPPP
ncbi:MAG: response regulator [Planctomycetales bacterium]|nr:response regulator [Planctomycetales bacterium]